MGVADPAWLGPVGKARGQVYGMMAERNLPGAAVAVATGGRLIWAEGFGYADCETRSPSPC
jgi:CubicO group peptidase (beta-lactamase class C family)